ncbi:MAG: glycosyltransferase [Planctomycetota bacterium]
MSTLEYIVIGLLIITQGLITLQVICNLYNAKKESLRKHDVDQPQCVLIVPCKGLDEAFDQNIESFFQQDYQGYHLWFVVQDRQDPAYERLLQLKGRFTERSKAISIKIWISGTATMASQKLHNLLYAYERVPEDTQVLAFADSDACAGNGWLLNLIRPLQLSKNGATSGYRCFIPASHNTATIALSALNAKICQFLGKSRWNLAWGGSMAIPLKSFKEYEIDKTWSQALSDDLSLSSAVRKHQKKMVFVPACMIASYVTMTWAELFEFARRQFIITRIYTPLMWWFALVNSFVNGFGVMIATILGIFLWPASRYHAVWYLGLATCLLVFQICRMVIRQKMIALLLPDYQPQFETVRKMDTRLFWLYSGLMFVLVLSSALGRTITWRGIRYKLHNRKNIEILDRSDS